MTGSMAHSLPYRTLLRRAALSAALGALLVPAAAGASTATASKAKKAPVITSARPMTLAVGDTLEIRGKNFTRGRAKNTVVFQRAGGKAVFVKAGIGTKKMLKVKLPDRLEKELAVSGGYRVPTRFQLRVLAGSFGKRFTKASASPLIAPKPAPAPKVDDDGPAGTPDAPGATDEPLAPVDIDTDGDGLLNSVDADDDNDLLTDAQEIAVNEQLASRSVPDELRMDTLDADTDDDTISDGYEYRSAHDLNSSFFLPYPGKRPYPNPLSIEDKHTDFDGDGLSLNAEYRLWRYQLKRTGETASLDTLSYSEGTQHSIYTRDASGRRQPALFADGYERVADFHAWLDATGFGTVDIPGDTGPRNLLDVNRDGVVSTTRQPGYPYAEAHYVDTDNDGVLTDDERDEDADGLSNIEEMDGESLRFRFDPIWWEKRYEMEQEFTAVSYRGTDLDDPDTDGDGVRDGADDQDYDDVPNLMELSRWAASGRLDALDATPETASPFPAFGRVNPFNPCLPNPSSRTCPRYVPFVDAWAPFDDSPDYFSFA